MNSGQEIGRFGCGAEVDGGLKDRSVMFKLCVDAALISFSPSPGPRVSGSDLPSFLPARQEVELELERT
jgi:hypothetical protein